MLHHLEEQKSLTTNQWKIFAAATIGDMLDFFDFYLIGFILAFVVKGWNLTYGESGLVLLASGHRVGTRARHAVSWPRRTLLRDSFSAA